jgi:type VI secretion system protein ImpA
MATPEVLDFDQLLAPISDEHPSGTELRDDAEGSALFFQVKESREAARIAERQLLHWYGEGDKPDPPNWRPVAEVAERILCEKSKDLWVAAWFLEALVRLHGFPGLRDGLRLIRQLCERYWAEIHPAPDEEGYGHTVSQLTGVFEGALAGPISEIAITPASASQPSFSGRDYTDACALEKLDPGDRSRRIEQGAVTLEMFARAVQPNQVEFFRDLLKDIDDSLQEFTRLSQQLDEGCGRDEAGYSAAPPTSAVREAISSAGDLVRSLTRDLLGEEVAAEAVADVGGTLEPAAGPSPAGPGGTPVGAIRSREDAFRALLLVADFFRRTEPHSPVSYSLEQAVRWGRMPFPELMSELIADESVRRDMFRRAGVSEPPGESH